MLSQRLTASNMQVFLGRDREADEAALAETVGKGQSKMSIRVPQHWAVGLVVVKYEVPRIEDSGEGLGVQLMAC